MAAAGGGGALARHGQLVEVLQSLGHLLWADVVHWMGRRLGTQEEMRLFSNGDISDRSVRFQ